MSFLHYQSLKKLLWPIIIVILIAVYYLTPLPRLLNKIGNPLLKTGGIFYNSGQGIKTFFQDLMNSRQYRSQMQETQKENVSLTEENVGLRFLEQENKELRALSQFKEKMSPHPILPAKIISANSLFGKKIIIIDRGTDDGVLPNLPIVSPDGALLGKTWKVNKQSTAVILLTDSDSLLAATIANNPKIQAIAKGKNGLSLTLELVPQEAQLLVGDVVVSSILEENTPAGLIIGKVISIQSQESELFKIGNIKPYFNINDISTVGIILPSS